ncbi:MAG: nucleotide sugar dehydrogenase [Deltaproteobacteria bacterium]|nr:nucleotide sugar dehydrogenase [Deltaproteobacteria bacterium]
MFEYDVCIVGTGRVGLPLGLSLMETGALVTGVDRDAALRDQVNSGKMPFQEPGYTELVGTRRFQIHDSPSVIANARALVITVGTPLHNHIETDLGQVRSVLESIAPHLRPGQLLCLRSTVAPGTTTYVARWLERHTKLVLGRDLGLAFCPERIVEGKAYEELRTLPQIIGTQDAASAEAAAALFGRLTNDLLHSDFVTAELVKLFNNITRYVHFALANHLALVSDTLGANIFEIQRLTNYKYPRHGVASPGFTAGTCLRKDFGMINEWTPYPDLLLSAWKMNEYMPMFIVQHLKQRTQIFERRIVVLGYTFKADSDDTRDSLVPKLLRYVERELPTELRVSDHHLPDPIVDPSYGTARNWNAKAAIEDADSVIIATNHTGYGNVLRELCVRRPDAWVADLWNVGKIGKVFYQARELAGLE